MIFYTFSIFLFYFIHFLRLCTLFIPWMGYYNFGDAGSWCCRYFWVSMFHTFLFPSFAYESYTDGFHIHCEYSGHLFFFFFVLVPDYNARLVGMWQYIICAMVWYCVYSSGFGWIRAYKIDLVDLWAPSAVVLVIWVATMVCRLLCPDWMNHWAM